MVGPVDRGVALAAVLTAFTRPALDKAPAFGFTAPVAGSGKSLMALSLSYLAGTPSADVMPGKVGDEEIRKRLLAIGRRASTVCIFDNVSGAFTSDSLCAWLTSELFGDRLLGISQDTTVPTKTLMLLTGNNLTLKGDLCRRVLLCRIDPKMKNPHKRSFVMLIEAPCVTHNPQEFAPVPVKSQAGHGSTAAGRFAQKQVDRLQSLLGDGRLPTALASAFGKLVQ